MTSYSSEPLLALRHNQKQITQHRRKMSISEDDQQAESKSQEGEKRGNQASGRWTKEEHHKFIEGLKKYGRNWKLVEDHIGTRSGAQIRSHAQKFFNRIEKQKEQNSNISEQQQQLLEIMNSQPKQLPPKPSPLKQQPQTQPTSQLQQISQFQSKPEEEETPTFQQKRFSFSQATQQQQQQQQKQQQQLSHESSKQQLNSLMSTIQQQQMTPPQSLQKQELLRQIPQNQFGQFQQRKETHTYPLPFIQKQQQQQFRSQSGISDSPQDKYSQNELLLQQQIQESALHHQQQHLYGNLIPQKSSSPFYIDGRKLEQIRSEVHQQILPPPPYGSDPLSSTSLQMKIQGSLFGGTSNDKQLLQYNNPINYHLKEDSNEIGMDFHHHYLNSISNYQNHQNSNHTNSSFKTLYEKGLGEANSLLNCTMKSTGASPLCYPNSSPPQNAALFPPLQLQPLEDKEEDEVDKYMRPNQENGIQDNSYFTEHHLADIAEPRLYDMCVLGQQDLSSSSLNFRSEVYLPNQRGQVKGRSRFGSFKLHDEENEISNLKYYNLRKASIDDQELKKKLKLNDGQSLQSSQLSQYAPQNSGQQSDQKPQGNGQSQQNNEPQSLAKQQQQSEELTHQSSPSSQS